MKNYFYFCFLLGLSSFAQNQQRSFQFGSNLLDEPKVVQFELKSLQFPISLKTHKLTIYNPTTQWNDVYMPLGSGYFLSRTMSDNNLNWLGYKTDSLNPTGTTNFPFFVGVGALNLLLNKY